MHFYVWPFKNQQYYTFSFFILVISHQVNISFITPDHGFDTMRDIE